MKYVMAEIDDGARVGDRDRENAVVDTVHALDRTIAGTSMGKVIPRPLIIIGIDDVSKLRTVSDEIRAGLDRQDEVRKVLRWVTDRYKATLAGESVRDADECIAAAERLTEGLR